jgi:RNA recognition motif-containing protein
MKIYVGNLSFQTTEAELSELFSQHGEVAEVSVITDRETGRSRGFGFVEMKDDNAARNAISALEGTELGGRRLTVNEARPRANSGGGGGFGGGRGGRDGGGRRDRW